MKIFRLKLLLISVALLGVACFAGCNNPQGTDNDDPVYMAQSHTLLMYLVGNNNLEKYLANNMTAAVKGANGYNFPANGKIFIYVNNTSGNTLYEIERPDGATKFVDKVVKEYDFFTSSTDPVRIREVVADVKELARTDTYGFVMGSHGAGWLPESFIYNNYILKAPGTGGTGLDQWLDFGDSMTRSPEFGQQTRAFGPDGRDWGVTEDLVEGLSGAGFQYLLFDQCFMSSVELLYDLRGVADYIVGSPVEIMGAGMPYDKIVPVIFSAENSSLKARLANVADTFVEYYESGTPYPASIWGEVEAEKYKSATMTVIESSRIDALAVAVRDIFEAGTTVPSVAEIQGLERLQNHIFFDLGDYIHNICSDVMLLDRFDASLDNMIVFERHTDTVYSSVDGDSFNSSDIFEVNSFCGVSSYIPREQFPVAGAEYYKTAWAKFIRPTAGI